MSTNKILPFPAIDVILDAPPVLKASENSFFPEQVAKRFRLVPNFFVSAPDALRSSKDCGPLLPQRTSTIRSQHSSKSGFLSSSRGSVRSATALYATPDFLWAMDTQRATPRPGRKPLSR
jgi:hypothetical protein